MSALPAIGSKYQQPDGPSGGLNLFLALRDYALVEAAELEQTAQDLESRAAEMRWRARGLREVHAAAAPYFGGQVSNLALLKEKSA